MVFENDCRYFRVCDSCGLTKEIKRQQYTRLTKMDEHLCRSCSQSGSRNHKYQQDPWNKGKTKETDIRIADYGKKVSDSKSGTVPWNKDGTYEDLKGKQWSDGFKQKISKIKTGVPNYKKRKSEARSKTASYFRHRCRKLLYTNWTRKVLERDNFRCQLCGYRKELEVHHVRAFEKILHLVADKLGYYLYDYKEFTDEQFERFRDEVVKEHKLEDGMTVCFECHRGIDENRRRFGVSKLRTIESDTQ